MGYNNEHAAAALTDKPYLIFDIETSPMPECGDYLVEPIEAPSNWKDPIKIAAYIEEKRKGQIADAGLDLDLCEVVAIGVKANGREAVAMTRGDVPEASLLSWFWQVAQSTNGDLIGFNCLHFDLPILLRRSLYLGIPTPKLSIDKYRHDGIVDLAELLSFSRKDFMRSLAFYAKRFGIPHDESVKGADIAGLCAAGEWEKVSGHVLADVASTAALALRVGVVQAARQPEPAGVL